MNRIVNVLFNICHIEELARRDIWINCIPPVVKIIITFAYILYVSSIEKYDLEMILLAGIYPMLVITAGNIPFAEIAKKMVVPMLMGASLGVLNPILDVNVVYLTDTLAISAGWISLSGLIIKSVWFISAALLLVSTTPIESIAYGLRQLRAPKVMTVQFLLMFRYITILINEIERVLTAYSMRSFGKRRITFKAWGPLVGQFFLRTSDRSVRLYEAMNLRGFRGEFPYVHKKFKLLDGLYMTFWIGIFGLLAVMRG